MVLGTYSPRPTSGAISRPTTVSGVPPGTREDWSSPDHAPSPHGSDTAITIRATPWFAALLGYHVQRMANKGGTSPVDSFDRSPAVATAPIGATLTSDRRNGFTRVVEITLSAVFRIENARDPSTILAPATLLAAAANRPGRENRAFSSSSTLAERYLSHTSQALFPSPTVWFCSKSPFAI